MEKYKKFLIKYYSLDKSINIRFIRDNWTIKHKDNLIPPELKRKQFKLFNFRIHYSYLCHVTLNELIAKGAW
jgi:hypothetical protein